MTPLWTLHGRTAVVTPPADKLAPTRRGRTAAARAGADRGSATLWLLACGLLLAASGLATAGLGAAHIARQRAQVAADLGALAGAMRAADGTTVACAAAKEIVVRNGGDLTSCDLDGLDVTVTVRVAVGGPAAGRLAAHATARAGPARADA